MCIPRFMILAQADQILDKEWRGESDSRQMGLINSNINHDEFVLINNVLNEYIKMKEEIKNLQA